MEGAAYVVALSALVTFLMQMSFFVIAYLCQFDKVTDFAGATNFLLLAWMTYAIGVQDSSTLINDTDFNIRKFLITLFITLWSVRLGSYLLYRVIQRGSDQRFDEMRGQFFQFLGFWLLQFVWVFVVSLPVITVNASEKNVGLKAQDYIGWALFLVGFIMEAWADNSKSLFVAQREKRGGPDYVNFAGNQNQNQNQNREEQVQIIMTGPWSISRHPNYFGEIIIWIGIFLSSCSVYSDNNMNWAFISIISPVITFILLMFGSGMTLAEERYNKKYEKKQWYLDYRNKTSPLIPLPTTLYQSLPQFIQKYVFFEYDLYRTGLAETEDNASDNTRDNANEKGNKNPSIIESINTNGNF